MINLATIRRIWVFVLFVFPVLVSGSSTILAPASEHAKTTALVNELVKNYHYSRPELDDEISSSTLERYLESLDPAKHFFMAGDIQSFEKYRYLIDDAIKSGDSSPAFQIYNVFQLRVLQRIKYARELLEQKPDFTVDEEYLTDYENSPWARDENEINELWRKRVKSDILNLKLSGKAENKIKDTLGKRYDRLLRRSRQQSSDDVYQLFVNSFTNSIDPHTSYYSPHNSENFNINMRLSLEGIGAALRSKNEYTVVQRIITGGPADLSGQLHSQDKIVGVGQDQTEMVDVIGWRLQDVVELIRGPKGSVVRLLLLPKSSGADGPTREITLVRDKIKLEEQAAKSSIIENPNGVDGVKIGVIDIPTFYLDFAARARGDDDYRSTTRDVKKLIQELKRKRVNGIVIDLRGNGGGSLSEATELTGLFIESGPVVQVKGGDGVIDVNRDSDPDVTYKGPLAVLVNRYSASASEIFAGAIQDYGRGILIGEPTFGKGTVQTLIDLNRFNNGGKNLGQLKVTVAQFFRVNGDSTQHRGVRPDIIYPMVMDAGEQGEDALDNALPWAKVKAADYQPITPSWYNLEALRNLDKSRIARDPGFKYLISTAKDVKAVLDQKSVSLNEAKRREQRDSRRKKGLDLENKFRQSRGLAPLTLADKNKDEEDLPDQSDKKDPVESIYLDEAVNILADYIKIESGRYAVNQNLQ